MDMRTTFTTVSGPFRGSTTISLMGGLVAFCGNSDDANQRGCIIIRAAPYRKVFDEKYNWA